jgi:hypothetical protein
MLVDTLVVLPVVWLMEFQLLVELLVVTLAVMLGELLVVILAAMLEGLLVDTLRADMLAVIPVAMLVELLTVVTSLVELRVAGTAVAGMVLEVGDLELANGVTVVTTVVKATTGPLVSKLQTTIKCYKAKAYHIKWAWARVLTAADMVAATALPVIIQ